MLGQACAGGVLSFGDESCSPGHTGRICGMCMKAWYRGRRKCESCLALDVGVTLEESRARTLFFGFSLLTVAASVILLYLQPPASVIIALRACFKALKVVTGGYSNTQELLAVLSGLFKVLLSYSQCLSSMTRFDRVQWPQIFVDFMNALGELVPDIFSVLPAECIYGERLGFYFELGTTLILPIVVLILSFLVMLLARVLSYCVGYGVGPEVDSLFNNDDGLDVLLEWYPPDDEEDLGKKSYEKGPRTRAGATWKSLKTAMKHPRFQNVLIFNMLFIYPMLCRKSIAVFDCVDAGGTSLLRDDPVVECFDGIWILWASIASFLGILIYGIGGPIIATESGPAARR